MGVAAGPPAPMGISVAQPAAEAVTSEFPDLLVASMSPDLPLASASPVLVPGNSCACTPDRPSPYSCTLDRPSPYSCTLDRPSPYSCTLDHPSFCSCILDHSFSRFLSCLGAGLSASRSSADLPASCSCNVSPAPCSTFSFVHTRLPVPSSYPAPTLDGVGS
ncbi:hypothetical protein AOLI_G00323070 [Acnodon oligacanthus]